VERKFLWRLLITEGAPGEGVVGVWLCVGGNNICWGGGCFGGCLGGGKNHPPPWVCVFMWWGLLGGFWVVRWGVGSWDTLLGKQKNFLVGGLDVCLRLVVLPSKTGCVVVVLDGWCLCVLGGGGGGVLCVWGGCVGGGFWGGGCWDGVVWVWEVTGGWVFVATPKKTEKKTCPGKEGTSAEWPPNKLHHPRERSSNNPGRRPSLSNKDFGGVNVVGGKQAISGLKGERLKIRVSLK